MKKSFKYRAYLNKKTKVNTENALNLCRNLYNICLEQRIMFYKYGKKSISCYDQMKQLPELKKEFTEYKEINSQTLQDVVERLDKAYQSFFRRIKNKKTAGFPRFKGKNRYDSFTLKQHGYKLEGRYLIVKNIGRFKLMLHRPIEGTIKIVTIRKYCNKWYVCFSCDNVPLKILPKTGKKIGIDVGCLDFITDSNGNKISNPRFMKKSEDLLAIRQQKLSTKKKNSNNRKKAKILVAKVHEKLYNQRNDFQFKVANKLVKENDVICIEDLKFWKTKYKNLNKSILDVSWFNFFNKLDYKAVEAGKIIVKVNPRNTSQMCSNCGTIVKKSLSVRIHNCPICKLTIDRDVNSAINILRLGTSLGSINKYSQKSLCLR